MKINRYFKENKWMPYAMAGCVTVLFYLLASHINYLFIVLNYLLNIITPVLTGIIFAYILDPLVTWLELKVFMNLRDKFTLRRVVSVWITIILFILFLAVLMVALVPQLVKSVGMFFTNFDYYAKSLQSFINSVTQNAAENEIDISSFTRMIDNAIENLADYIQDNLGNIVNKSINVGMGIANTVISFILAIYMLCDKERILKAWKRFLQAVFSDKFYEDLASFWRRCNRILVSYIAGDLLDGLIVGVLNAIVMTVSGMGYVALISVIVGLTNLAPTFGPIVGAVFGAFILVFVNPWHALWFIIITIFLQSLDAYVIKPKLFGNSLGISALWILISIIVFGRMFGIIGILLAIPFAAIFDILYKEVFLRRLEQRKKEKKAALAKAKARVEAEQAAVKAAEEAIKAVVQNDSHLSGFEEEKMKLANDPDIVSHLSKEEEN